MEESARNEKIKIGIIGLGPVGMILAVKLQEAGCDVALCEVNAVKANKIRQNGITLEHVIKAHATFDHVYESITEFRDWDPDFLFFAMKSHQTAAAVREAEKINTEKLTVVSAHNGIDVENILAAGFGESKTLRLVINFAGNTTAPNVTRVSFFNPPNYIGSINETITDKAALIGEIMSSVGLETKTVGAFEIVKRSWEKTILNSSLSALCGVGRLTMAEAVGDPDTAELIEQIIHEAVDVAEKERIYFPDDFVRYCMRYLQKGGDHFPSLAIDLINQRPTEIDYFNGKIVEYGKKHYVRTSLNLSFTNMVKAMTNKNIMLRVPGATGEFNKKILDKGLIRKQIPVSAYRDMNCFLGIDLGSAYSKITVIDENAKPLFRYVLPALSADSQSLKSVMQSIESAFHVRQSCATGYGRKQYGDTDLVKTEIHCAAAAVSYFYPGEKNIIDVGGEDIKIIRCNAEDGVESFYMNDKCAAGTGSFLSEIAERAHINLSDMSTLASSSEYDKELNSFCTVFAKTEIMNWIFEGMAPENISRGIYNSIANKVAKMRLDPGVPTYMIGGVIAYHPYLRTILSEKFHRDIQIVDTPQYAVSFGAAVIAMRTCRKQAEEPRVEMHELDT